MNWYLAKLIFHIRCGEEKIVAQFDEQFRLICASGKQEAFCKARSFGKQEEKIFFNHKKQLAHWQFINVSELYKLGELMDGAELYSRITEVENADSYLGVIHKKAEQISSGNTLEILDLV